MLREARPLTVGGGFVEDDAVPRPCLVADSRRYLREVAAAVFGERPTLRHVDGDLTRKQEHDQHGGGDLRSQHPNPRRDDKRNARNAERRIAKVVGRGNYVQRQQGDRRQGNPQQTKREHRRRRPGAAPDQHCRAKRDRNHRPGKDREREFAEPLGDEDVPCCGGAAVGEECDLPALRVTKSEDRKRRGNHDSRSLRPGAAVWLVGTIG